MSQKIAIVSGKGGTGKSTIAVCVSKLLASENKSVLLIDCDSGMRNIDLMLGISKSIEYDISDVIAGKCSIQDAIYNCGVKNKLFFVPAPKHADDQLSPLVFKKYLEAIEDAFDYVIIDCSAGIGSNFDAAVLYADRTLVVCNPDQNSVRCSMVAVQKLKKMNIKNNRLVINKFDGYFFSTTNIFNDIDEIIDTIGIRLIAVIPEDKDLIANINSFTDITKGSIAGEAIKRLVQRVLGEEIPLDFE